MIATKTKLSVYVELTITKRKLEEQIKDTKARLAELEPAIIEQFQENGVQSMNIDGYTVYLNRKLFAGAKDGDKEAMITALQGCDDETWSFLVGPTVNSQQLAARIRECDMDENSLPILPDSLKSVIAVHEQFRVGARKSG